MDKDHEPYAERGERNHHPRRTHAAELGLLFEILAKAQDDNTCANRKGDETKQQIVWVGHN